MTTEDKAAADAKANEAKQTKETQSTKDTTTETEGSGSEEEEEEDPDEKPKYSTKAYKKLQTEAKARREENERLKKALGVATGKSDEEDPVEKAQKATAAKFAKVALRAAVTSVARDAHDPKALLDAYPSAFKDIEVDPDTGEADEEAVTAAVDKLRKTKAFLFEAKAGDGGGGKDTKTEFQIPKKGGKLPLDGGQPKTGTNHYSVWKGLTKEKGREWEAQAYYKEHMADIKATMPKSG